jgi:hypothetical protein
VKEAASDGQVERERKREKREREREESEDVRESSSTLEGKKRVQGL